MQDSGFVVPVGLGSGFRVWGFYFGASMNLTMGYDHGPSADLLVLVCVTHEPLWPNSHPFEDTLLAGSAAVICTRGLDVIRKEAWSVYKTISGVRLFWELEEPKGPKGGPKGRLTIKCSGFTFKV